MLCSPDLLALEGALQRLQTLSPRQAEIVEARFFGGYSCEECAVLLEVSEATVMRDWRAARAWLASEIKHSMATPLQAPANSRRNSAW